MIKKIPLSDLDPKKWNQLVLDSDSAPFYCLFEVLSGLNSKWIFIVDENGSGGYDAGMPIPLKNFLWKKRVVQPAFCQQLGIIAIDTAHKSDFLERALSIIDIDSWAYHFNETDSSISSGIDTLWELKPNLVLSLNHSQEEIRSSYNSNLKRKLKTAAKSDLTISKQEPNDFCPLFISEYTKLGTRTSKKALENVCSVIQSDIPEMEVDLELVRDTSDRIMAGGIFIGFGSRITYWSGFSTVAGKDLGAMAYLMEGMISKSVGKYSEFDFETGNLPGTRRFFSQFKPEERKYPVLIKK